jgi:hypothetical protein
MHMSGIRVEGITDAFKYDPKQFSVMLSVRL